MFDLSMLHHHCARMIESLHGVDHPRAISERRNGDHMAAEAKLYELQCRKSKVANDV